MKKKYRQLSAWCQTRIKSITPGKTAVKGATLGLLSITLVLWLLYSILFAKNIKDPWVLLLFLGFTLAALLVSYLSLRLLRLLHNIPKNYLLALLISVPLLFLLSFDTLLPLFAVLTASLLGASIVVLKHTGLKNLSVPKKVVTLLGLLLGLGGLIGGLVSYIPSGFDVDPIANAALESSSSQEHITAESPAKKGPYAVKSMTYGSGTDLHRTGFGAAADIKTEPVNGLAFIDDWDGFGGWWRETYWGFDAKSLPLNAQVWYPEGEGPFPLALIVHGNHSMQDYSDIGYAYLGELLASRGIILASVDENFINASWSDIFGGLDEENDARGWLLLEHLKLWHQWNEKEGHLFQNKIDTSKLALIGHSRGGEAVGHAAMFNSLPFYPDDASIPFDYNFDLKSIVAIAPVDGQYKPGDSGTTFTNVNYFVLHGAQDSDVNSFAGAQQYERVSFQDSLYHFKSGLYIYGANHGQFNSSWGNNDVGNPFTGLLNLKQLLPAEDQRKIAEVYISGFLEATLREKHEYLPMFADARTAKDWLPETIYLNQFQDSNTELLCTFDEDFDVTTASDGQSTLSSENLTVWREQEIQLKWEKKGSRALFIGWDYDLTENQTIDSITDSRMASYSIEIPATLQRIDSTATLVFSMAESTESTTPKKEGKWMDDNAADETEDEEENVANETDAEADETEDEGPKKPLDFSISVKDSTGQTVRFPLSKFSGLQREIEPVLWKMEFLTGDTSSEQVFQLFYFPVDDMVKINPSFDPKSIQTIKFVFDKSENGVVVIDNIGFMKSL